MSKTVDERVLEMRFDNKQFESNVKQSMSTLDRLKAALKFDKGVNGLDKIGKAAKNVNMSGLASSVDQVKRSFSALDVIGVTALANITNSAVNAGKKMVKALTLDPIMTGFQEYETKINAVQTIMANTAKDGMTMQDVTNVLDDLNYYADKTIYNFTEMTRNIGTFTAAGVGLYDAAGAIKGIANLAAVSGSNSYQASTAMYQLSQALATGRVALQDWNSVVNAGMGGTKFQEALKQTARDMGVAVDSIIKKYGSFRDSLTKGEWLTSEVLSQTLKNFTVEGAQEYAEKMVMLGKYTQEQADALMREAQIAEDAATKVKTFTQLWDVMKEAAQSGWAQTWETIIGDFEEAKQFLTPIGDLMSTVIAESANARNSVLESGLRSNWKTLSNDIRACGIDMNDFQEKLISVGKEHGVITDEMIVDAGGFESSLKSGWASGDIFAEALRSYKKTGEDFGITTEQMQDKLTAFQETVKDVWSQDMRTPQERMRALSEAGYDYNEIQGLINQTLHDQKISLEDLSVAQMQALGFTENEIMALQDMATEAETTGTRFNDLINDLTKPSGRELFLEGFTNVLMNFINILDTVKAAWANVFPPIEGSTLYGWMEGFRDLTERLMLTETQLVLLRETFEGVFSVMHMVFTAVVVPLKVAFEMLSYIIPTLETPLLAITAGFGQAAQAMDKLIFQSGAYEKAVRALPDTLMLIAGALHMWFQEFLQLPQVQAAIEKVRTTIDSALAFILERLSATGEAMRDFIERIKEMDTIHLTDLPNIFKDFYDNVLSTAIDFDSIFATIKTGLTNFVSTVKTVASTVVKIFQTIASKLSSATGKLKTVLRDNLDFSDIFAVLISTGTLVGLQKFGKVLEIIAGPIEGVSKVLNKFTEVLGSVEKYINAKAWAVKANSIKSIATALLILAGALYVISNIPTEDLGKSLASLGLLAAGLIGFTAALQKIGGPVGVEKLGITIAAFGAAIALMGSALKSIGDIESGKLLGSVIALEVIIASLAGVALLLAHFAPALSTGSPLLLSFGVAVKILVSSLKTLSKIDVKELPKTITLLVGVIAALGAMAAIAAGSSLAGAAGILLMVVSVKAISMMLNSLGDIDVTAAMKSVMVIIPILGLIKVMMNMISGLSAGTGAIKAGATIAIMSAAIISLSIAMRLIADIPVQGAITGIVAINTFLLSFSVVLIFLNGMKGKIIQAGIALTAMAVAIGILSGVMVLLGKIDPSGLGRALAAIVLLEACFAAILVASKFATGEKATIMALSVSIAVLAASMAALSLLDPKGLVTATACISAIMGMFTLLIRATGVAKKAYATIFIMLGVIALLTAMMVALGALPIEASIASAASISLLLVTMTASLYALSALRESAYKGIGALAVLTTVVALIAGILATLTLLEVEPSIETAASISLLLGAMTGVFVVLAKLGPIATSAIPAAGAFDAVIGIIGGLMVAIGALSKWIPDLKDFLNEGIVVLSAIAEGIGAFVGHLVGGVAEAFTTHLGPMADNLSDFMTRLQPFLDNASKVKPGVIDSVNAISEMMLKLTGADILSGISSFINGGSSLAEFAESLVPFGEALANFADVTKTVNARKLSNVANAAKVLVEMANSLPESGGLKEKIQGAKDMKSFIEDLDPLADALIDFSKKTTAEGAIDTKGIKSVADAAQKIVDLANSLPSQGGLREKIVGTKDLVAFAEQIGSLGSALVDYSSTVGDINVEKINQVTEAGQALANLNMSLPSIGGVAQFFAGEKNLGTFGEQLIAFGSAISGYSAAVSAQGAINAGAIENSAAAAQIMVDLANNLPDPGFFSLQYDFIQFGNQLTAFGEAIASYVSSVSGIGNFTVVETSATAAQTLVDLMKTLPENELLKNETWLDEFGDMISSFGDSFAAFSTSVSGIDTTAVSNVVDIAKTMADVGKIMENVSTDSFKQLIDTMRDVSKIQIEDTGDTLVAFGSDLVAFSNSISNVDFQAIQDFGPVLQALVNMQNSLPQVSSGTESMVWLDDFSQKLVVFGNNLVTFQTNTKDIKADQLTNIGDAASVLADLAVSLSGIDMEGFSTFVSSMKDFAKVGTNLATFQQTMSEGELDVAKLTTATDALKVVGDFAKEFSGIDMSGFTDSLDALKAFGKVKLDGLSDNLDTFADAAISFSKKVAGNIDSDSVTSAASAGEAIAKLAEALPETSLADKLRGQKQTLTEFSSVLPEFGKKIAEFSGWVKGEIDDASVDSAIRAGYMISGLIKSLPEEEVNPFVSKMDLAGFAEGLPEFGKLIATFGNEVKGKVDDASVDSAIRAGYMIAGFMESLPETSVMESFGTSKMSLTEFAKDLPELGKQISYFSNWVSGEIDSESVDAAIAAAQSLAGFFDNLPQEGGIFDSIFGGRMDVSTFSNQLPVLGQGLRMFALNIGQIGDMDMVGRATGIAQSLAEILNSLPEGAGSQNAMGMFGTQIKNLGADLAEFATSLQGVNLGGLQMVADSIQPFIGLAGELNGANVGGALKSFADGLSSVADVSISNIVAKLNGGADSVRNAVNNLMSAFNSGLADNSMIPTKTITDTVNRMVTEINNASPKFSVAANGIMNGFSTAIEQGTSTIKQTFINTMQDCVNAIRSVHGAFVSAGGYLMTGLSQGMESKRGQLKAKAQAIARELSDTINNALEVNSPSRVTMRTGNFVMLGLAKGLTDNVKVVKEAGGKAASAVITSMQDELQINSPSIKARDEVGKYIIDGIAEGIEANMKAEEAAEQKAQNIIEAFQNELAKFQWTWDTADLQFQLFEALNEDVYSEQDMKKMKLEHEKDKLKYLAETAENARGQYQYMVDTFGEGSDNAKDAYQEWLQAQIDVANQAKSIKDTIKDINESITEYNEKGAEIMSGDRWKAYQEALEKMKPAMDQFGYTFEQIDEIARKQTGYGNFVKQELLDTTKTIKDYVNEAMSGVTGLYSDFAKTNFGKGLEEYAKTGAMIGDAITTGVSNSQPKMEEASTNLTDIGEAAILNKTSSYENAGKTLGEALADGINAAQPAVDKAVNNLVNSANQATKAVETVKKSNSQNSPGVNSGKTNLNTFTNVSGQTVVGTPLKGGWIKIDTESTDRLASQISNETSRKLANDVASQIQQSGSSKSLSGGETAKITNNYTFTQNNTSPKALNASTLYRHSNNLFSLLKTRA